MIEAYDVYMCREQKLDWTYKLTDEDKRLASEHWDRLMKDVALHFKSKDRYTEPWLKK